VGIFTEASQVQYSFQPRNEMSIYTKYLVEGIETGSADINKDQKISLDELHEYVSKQISENHPNLDATPHFFNLEKGGKIYIAKVVQSKAQKLDIYRQELENLIQNGELSPVAEILLTYEQIKLGLTDDDVGQIKVDLLQQPIASHQNNLQKYEAIVKQMIAEKNPLTDQDKRDLQDLKKHWGLERV